MITKAFDDLMIDNITRPNSFTSVFSSNRKHKSSSVKYVTEKDEILHPAILQVWLIDDNIKWLK